jgi:hypothetical protein
MVKAQRVVVAEEDGKDGDEEGEEGGMMVMGLRRTTNWAMGRGGYSGGSQVGESQGIVGQLCL